MESLKTKILGSLQQPLETCGLLLRIFSRFGCIPFRISFENKVLKVLVKPEGSMSVLLWKSMSIWTCVGSVFLLVDLLNHYKVYLSEDNYLEFIFHIVWVACFLLMCIYQIHFQTQRRNVANLITQVISLGEYLKDGFFKEEFEHSWRRMNLVMGLFFLNACSGILCYTLLFLQFPTHRRYVYGFLNPNWHSTPLLFMVAFYEAYFIAFQWGGLFAECFLHFLYMGTTTTALGLIRTSNTDTLSTLDEKAKLYQKIHLLSKIYADSSEGFVLPALQLALGLIVTFSVAAAIQLFQKMDPIVISILVVFSIVTTSIQFYIYTKASKIHQRSTEVEDYFHCMAETRREKVICRACPPIGVSIGSFFVLRRGTPLTALGIIINAIINVLLA